MISIHMSPSFPSFQKSQRVFKYEAWVGIGGNMGAVKERFERLMRYWLGHPLLHVEQTSPIVQNPPFGVLEQPDFFNAIAKIRTSLSPQRLLKLLLHTEKPPYRFPHTAADCLFAEQVAVCAGAGQRQHQNIIFYAVDKQPVRENVTFPMACPIAGQVMVTVLIRQRFAHRQQRYDLLQQLDLQATLDGSFVVFFETGRVLDGIFGFFHLFRSANNSSRSL